MTSINQRAELKSKIWKIANDVRGSVDGWDFKQFVLGALFYRFISENFTNYIKGGDEGVNYASLPDDVLTSKLKEDAFKTKGYFILPSQLFVNVTKTANSNTNLNTDLASIFTAIESSTDYNTSDEDGKNQSDNENENKNNESRIAAVKGLFADFDTTSSRLGNTVQNKNSRLAAVLKGVEELNFGKSKDNNEAHKFEDNQIDLFGDAYEFLISNYAANAGKSGGEFFTPQTISKLIAQLALHKQTKVNKIYDPAAGSSVSNTEDHLRNHGFIFTNKSWKLSPAYDINPIETGMGLKLNISENDNALVIDLAMEVIPYFRLDEKRASEIVQQVKFSIQNWRKIASKYGISKTNQELKARVFTHAESK